MDMSPTQARSPTSWQSSSASKKAKSSRFARHQRPALAHIDTEKDSLAFMQVDVDYYTDGPHPRFARGSAEEAAVVRMYGVTREGNSIVAHVHGFQPYFYTPCPDYAPYDDPDQARVSLEKALKQDLGQRAGKCSKLIRDVKVVERESIMYFHSEGKRKFFQVTVAMPQMVPACRKLLEMGLDCMGGTWKELTFESNIPFALRFMIDNQIAGGSWCQARAGNYTIRSESAEVWSQRPRSFAQIEIDLNYMELIAHAAEGQFIEIAPLRVLSFDIECLGSAGFPTSDKDPVIQIAATYKAHGSDESFDAVWSLKTCGLISDVEVYCFDSELEMLKDFRDFVNAVDPDLLTGYNIQGFDLPYLFERAQQLQREANEANGTTLDVVKNEFAEFGRLRGKYSLVKERYLGPRQANGDPKGKVQKDVTMEGRVQFDMMMVVKAGHNLRSYSLNAVAAEFLGDQKDDVHYSVMGELFRKDAESRKRLAMYCLKDAQLPMRLFDKLMCLFNYVEMARVTGTPINFLLNRGQAIKVVSQLLRKARMRDYVVPTMGAREQEGKFEGAIVLEPERDFYRDPIATLDFASLYPSIMMAHNLCYSTLLPPSENGSVMVPDGVKVAKSPHGDVFVAAEHRQGVLPQILNELMAARKRAKLDLKEATDPLKRSVLDGRQLALKVSANSVYGFTGAQNGMLPCLAISSSVTSYGRTMIEETKRICETRYTKANGYPADAKVVYGDTDSVFVKFGVKTVAEAMKLGEEAAAEVSDTFKRPIKLEFEKVYHPFLLMNKKRYAGLYWTNAEKWDKLDTKGIETARRDNALLVKRVIEDSLRNLLIHQSVPKAVERVRKVVSDLLQGKIDLSLLVLSKSLGRGARREDYAVKTAHVELAEKMRERDPATAPGKGDRVPYVFVKGTKHSKGYERVEDPSYVLEHGIPIDPNHYITNQLTEPLKRIFDAVLPDAESVLFSGEHTRKRVVEAPKTMGGMMAFVTKGKTCLGPKCQVQVKGNVALCKSCKSTERRVTMQVGKELQQQEREFNMLWSHCQACQGSCTQEILCANVDCPIFYRRKKIQVSFEKTQEKMHRLRAATAIEW